MINNISYRYGVITKEHSSLVYAKTISRLINKDNEVVLIILIDNNKVELKTVCSSNLIEKGFNCYYVTELILKSCLKKSVVGGCSGGGKHGHAGFHCSISFLNDHFVDVINRMMKEYLINYEKEFIIHIK